MPDHDEVIDHGETVFLEAAAVADMALPPAWRRALRAGVGSALAILLLQLAGRELEHPLLLAPFGASCVLLFVAPQSEFAQPRNVLLGYVIATVVGFVALWLFAGQWWAPAVAVGATIVVMCLTHTVHPPAGAHPLVIVMGAPPLTALLTTLGAGLALLLLWAWAFHRLSRRA
jgi:CBS-domain-containing membrane protein